jgi:stearoyl-CoA desaturase (Delta-9 desaturase)
LFSHLTFQARWPVKLFTLLFGAAAFEGSVLVWAADHRRHHKFADQDDDPHDITKGFFHAHIGWLLFRRGPDTPLTWVRDLQKDRLAVWQHQHYVPLALTVGFGLPLLAGFLWDGWTGALGAFLIAGAARIVFVHHMTFCINSLCHWIGKQPYSSRCTARDSLIMAFFTFGEGYHNFHHEFQHDYRNGVKPWQFDPTKWMIWLLNRAGLASKLRKVPDEVILKAQIAERKRLLTETLSDRQTPISESLHAMLHNAQEKMHAALAHWEELLAEYRAAAERRGKISRRHRKALRRRVRQATARLHAAVREWTGAHELIYSAIQAA